jgi:leader peptidase (prepilin peptidase)/N-methyltransferase
MAEWVIGPQALAIRDFEELPVEYLLASLSLLLVAAGDASSLGLPLWALEWIGQGLLGLWLFALGACVGSFLNVVVYRLPQGMDLAHPGSHCPSCGHAIRARDNLPLLGWLLLRGQCRDCRDPISPRYYFVELFSAILFVLVAIFEGHIAADGLRLGGGLAYQALSPVQPFPFWTAYAVHVVLLVTLLAAALIEGDGLQVPAKLYLPATILALVTPLLWPAIRPLPTWPGLSLPPWQAGIVDGASGLAAGLAIGVVVAFFEQLVATERRRSEFAAFAMWGTIGAAVGWQPTIVLAPLVVLIAGAIRTNAWLFGATREVPLPAIALPLVAWVLTGQAAPLRGALHWLIDYPVQGSAVLMAITAAACGWAAAIGFRRNEPPARAAADHPLDHALRPVPSDPDTDLSSTDSRAP